MMKNLIRFDYVWLDGSETKEFRTKTRYSQVEVGDNPQEPPKMEEIFSQIPPWSFDGSSTNQAETESSDLLLRPVRLYPNPFVRQGQNTIQSFVVFCEVFNIDGTPHETNTRAKLRELLDSNKEDSSNLIMGIEQEYVFWDPINNWPSGWLWDKENEEGIYPEEQGRYYCGVGPDVVLHRQLAESHAQICLSGGLPIEGFNAEVMKSQWEYQLIPLPPMDSADSLWMSRYYLMRVAEQRGICVNFDPKPIEGDWNGSGAHINFSTNDMREGKMELLEDICKNLGESHNETLLTYGKDNEKRLTGENETSSFDKFNFAELDRTASIRIPLVTVNNDGSGYLEDRRPAANMDPYEAFSTLITIMSSNKEEALV
tara:strand:+ start:561 stop:1673 length:1113 start_codon:yes stop_codon:yes gene_type:complete